jgi:elongator complex protein 2
VVERIERFKSGHVQKTLYVNHNPYMRSQVYCQQFVHSAVLSGHEDWVKTLAFRFPDTNDPSLILASGSQDATIRLWIIEPFKKPGRTTPRSTEAPSDDLLDHFEASLGDIADGDEGGRQISLKRHVLTVKDAQR